MGKKDKADKSLAELREEMQRELNRLSAIFNNDDDGKKIQSGSKDKNIKSTAVYQNVTPQEKNFQNRLHLLRSRVDFLNQNNNQESVITEINNFLAEFSYQNTQPLFKQWQEYSQMLEKHLILGKFEHLNQNLDNFVSNENFDEAYHQLDLFSDTNQSLLTKYSFDSKLTDIRADITQKEQSSLFKRVILRSKSLKFSQLSFLLNIPENDLLKWLIRLPDEYGFVIDKDTIEFNKDLVEKHIDELLKSFEDNKTTAVKL